MNDVNKKRILIIDDEEDFGKIVKMNLELTNAFQVAIAIEGMQGITLAKEIKPDLILCDMLMPGMNGPEVVALLQKDQETKAIPVVMLTAKGDEETMATITSLCGDKYLIKPVDANTVEKKIDEVLNRK